MFINFNLTSRIVLAVSLLGAIGCSPAGDEGEDVDTSAHSIVGGNETQPGAWAGTVALYMGTQQGCGGSLVADSWVLTAGHCVNPTASNGGISKVVIGRHRLSTTAGETRLVDAVHRHQGFSWEMDNDIALLHLSSPSSLPKARVVSSAQAAAIVAGATTTVVGWGNTSESGAGGTSDVLHEVSVPVIANAQCQTLPQYSNVTENMICVGLPQGAKDSCQGDSGGPLFMTIGGQTTQIGLVSWGIGCARPNAPGVYTNIKNYLAWLHTKTSGAIGEAAPVDNGGGDGGSN